MRYIIIFLFISLFLVGCSSAEEERGMTIDEHVKVHEELVAKAAEEAAEAEAEEEEEQIEEEVVEEEPEEEPEVEEEPEGPQPGQNLFDPTTVEQGVWMGYEGQLMHNNSDMVLSQPIEYDPSRSYAINNSAYVSYYNGESFIETVRYSDVGTELLIEPRQEADSIRISIPSNRSDSFEFIIK